MAAVDPIALVRPGILNLTPYSSARDEYTGSASVFLDANENPFNAPFNRYPDPLQWSLKHRIAAIKGVDPQQVFLGNGSDEAIDLLIRVFCEPGMDEIFSLDPSYGMYEVAAAINHVRFVKFKLSDGFEPDVDTILQASSSNTKILFLCSPNNPTSNSYTREAVLRLLNEFNGILVIDEAYIDFSATTGYLREIDRFGNLVILQTLSKAWGLAGIRLGMAFASPKIVKHLNKVKYPYNVNILTQQKALEMLARIDLKSAWVAELLEERALLSSALANMECIVKVYPSDANFLLVKTVNPTGIYNYLVERAIIVRDRSKVILCEGCLRITVGTHEENIKLCEALKDFKA